MPKKVNKIKRNKWRNRGQVSEFDIGDIYFRPLNPYDALKHKEMCDVSLKHLGNYLGWAENIQKWHLKDHIKWIIDHSKLEAPYEALGAFHEDQLIGFFTYSPGHDFMGVQICYYVSDNAMGRGIATLATDVLVQKAFTLAGFSYVELHIDVENVGSQRVAQKVGFEPVITYNCPKSGNKGSGVMQVWVKLNPSNGISITLEDFKEEKYAYLAPAYQNLQFALASARLMREITDKIKRAKMALAGEIPLSSVSDILGDELERQMAEKASRSN